MDIESLWPSVLIAVFVNIVAAAIVRIMFSTGLLTAIFIGVLLAIFTAIVAYRQGFTFPIALTWYTRQSLAQFRRLGLKSAEDSLRESNYDPKSCMSKTSRKLDFKGMLGSKWVSDPEIRNQFTSFLDEVEADNGQVRFLLADPNGAGYEQLSDMRQESLSEDADHYHRYVKLNEEYDCFEVRLYTQIPTFRMVFLDNNELIISRYRYRQIDEELNRAWDVIPHLVINSNEEWSLEEPFRHTFDHIWTISESISDDSVDLTSFK